LDINGKMKTSQTTRLALVLGGVVLVAYLLSNYSSAKAFVGESMEQLKDSLGKTGPLADMGPYSPMEFSKGGNAQPSESIQARHPSSQSTYSQTVLNPSEMLPKGELGASWAAVNPASMGDLKGQNFLEAGYHTNTAIAGVSQTNRNSSWDVRSEDPNPQVPVGPFINTTIEANPFKRGLDGCVS
jgi:hypothetical protein